MSCTANALPGAEITWKKGSNVLSTGGIYEIGTATYSNDNINFKVAMTLKITATASTAVEQNVNKVTNVLLLMVALVVQLKVVQLKSLLLGFKVKGDLIFFSCSFSSMAFIKY